MYLKSAVIISIKKKSIGPYLGLSIEILCTIIDEGATNLPEVKIRGLKKI